MAKAGDWYALPSGAHASRHDETILVQRTSCAGRLCQAVLLTEEDIVVLYRLAFERSGNHVDATT